MYTLIVRERCNKLVFDRSTGKLFSVPPGSYNVEIEEGADDGLQRFGTKNFYFDLRKPGNGDNFPEVISENYGMSNTD